MKTYSLAEVAAMVLPPGWVDGERWLTRRLNRREIRGYRAGRIWRMTDDHIADLIARYENVAAAGVDPGRHQPGDPSAAATSVTDGLSQRARRRLRSAL